MPNILPLLGTLHLCFRNLTDIYELNKIAKPVLPPPSCSRNLQLQFSDVFIDMSWPTNWSDFYWILLHTLDHTEIMIMNSFCLFLTSYKECLIFGATCLGFLVSWAYLVEIDKKWCLAEVSTIKSKLQQIAASPANENQWLLSEDAVVPWSATIHSLVHVWNLCISYRYTE